MAVILEKRNLCGLVIDATVSEGHSMTSTVTQEPISTGSNVSDHMFTNQPEIVLNVTISDTAPKIYRQGNREPRRGFEDMPINNDESLLNQSDFINSVDPDFQSNVISENKKNAGITHFGSKSSNFEAGQGEYSSRTGAAWCRLMELQENKEVCELVTGLKVYDEVVVTGVSTEQNKDRTDKIDVQITLRRIKRVNAGSTTISQIDTGKGNVPRGNQNPKCLRLSEVFGGGDASAGSSISELTQIISNTGSNVDFRTARFSVDVWNQDVCGKFSARYERMRNSINRLTKNSFDFIQTESETGGAGLIIDLPFRNPVTTGVSGNLEVLEVQNACQELLLNDNYAKSCSIPTACQDTRFLPAEKDEDANSGTTSSTVKVIDNRAVGRVEVGTPEIIAEDPNSEFYTGSSVGSSDISTNGVIDVFEFGKIQQAQRVDCYAREVLSDLATGNDRIAAIARTYISSDGG